MAQGQRRHPSLTSESAAEGSDAQRTGENAFLTLPAATRKKRENRSGRKPRQSRAMYDENVWLVMNFRDHPVGRSWRSNDSRGAAVAWQWRGNGVTATQAQRAKQPNRSISPTTKSERKKHVTSQRKQKPMNEQPNEIYWIIEIMKYRIIETINYRNNEISKYRDNELSNYRNKKNVIKRT